MGCTVGSTSWVLRWMPWRPLGTRRVTREWGRRRHDGGCRAPAAAATTAERWPPRAVRCGRTAGGGRRRQRQRIQPAVPARSRPARPRRRACRARTASGSPSPRPNTTASTAAATDAADAVRHRRHGAPASRGRQHADEHGLLPPGGPAGHADAERAGLGGQVAPDPRPPGPARPRWSRAAAGGGPEPPHQQQVAGQRAAAAARCRARAASATTARRPRRTATSCAWGCRWRSAPGRVPGAREGGLTPAGGGTWAPTFCSSDFSCCSLGVLSRLGTKVLGAQREPATRRRAAPRPRRARRARGPRRPARARRP